MKSLACLMLALFVSSAEAGNYHSCEKIQLGLSVQLGQPKPSSQISSDSELEVPMRFKITDSELLAEPFIYFQLSLNFVSSLAKFSTGGNYSSYGEVIEANLDYDKSLKIRFHGGTSGEFTADTIRVLFAGKAGKFSFCKLSISPIVVNVKNISGKVDMVPPQVLGASLEFSVQSQTWHLNLNVFDDSHVQLFEPGDTFVPHFTLLDLGTSESTNCYNRNLRQQVGARPGQGYYVDLFDSQPNDSLIQLPAGNYQLT